MAQGLDVVLATLQKASSQIPEEFKPAEATLENWQNQSGFYSTLVEVIFFISFIVKFK